MHCELYVMVYRCLVFCCVELREVVRLQEEDGEERVVVSGDVMRR